MRIRWIDSFFSVIRFFVGLQRPTDLWQRRVQVVGFQFSLKRVVGSAVSEKNNDDRNAVAMTTLSLNHPGR